MRPDDALMYLLAHVTSELQIALLHTGDHKKADPILWALIRDVEEVILERLESAYGKGFDPSVYLDGTQVWVTAKSGELNRAVTRIRKPGDPQGISDAEKAWLEGKDLEGK